MLDQQSGITTITGITTTTGITTITGITDCELTPDELVAWARGYLAGYDTGGLHGYAAGHDDLDAAWIEDVRRWARISERAGHALRWRLAVLRGEHPRG